MDILQADRVITYDIKYLGYNAEKKQVDLDGLDGTFSQTVCCCFFFLAVLAVTHTGYTRYYEAVHFFNFTQLSVKEWGIHCADSFFGI